MSIDPESSAWFSAGPAEKVWVDRVSGARSLAKVPWATPTRAGAWVRFGKYPKRAVTGLSEPLVAAAVVALPPAAVMAVVEFDEADEEPQAAAQRASPARPTATVSVFFQSF